MSTHPSPHVRSPKVEDPRWRAPYGFTLIELLVVITILVVLLALLAPALDKAVYQAELAVCAANLDAIATGAVTYASAQRRAYPTRFPASATPIWGWPQAGRRGSQRLRPA